MFRYSLASVIQNVYTVTTVLIGKYFFGIGLKREKERGGGGKQSLGKEWESVLKICV